MSKEAALLTLPASIKVTPPVEVRAPSVAITTVPSEVPEAMLSKARSAVLTISNGWMMFAEAVAVAEAVGLPWMCYVCPDTKLRRI